MYERKLSPKTKALLILYAFIFINMVLFLTFMLKVSNKIRTINVESNLEETNPSVQNARVNYSLDEERILNKINNPDTEKRKDER